VDIMRLELRSDYPDGLTMLRQLQILLELNQAAAKSPLASARTAMMEIGVPKSATEADSAASHLDDAANKINQRGSANQTPDRPDLDAAKTAFATSYGGALGKWAAGVTTAAAVAAVGVATGLSAAVAGRLFEIGRWIVEVLRQGLPR
jgi:hypothetical protein